jgi:hypothetical protein
MRQGDAPPGGFMKTAFNPLYVFLAILLGLAVPALAQGNTMSVIDLSTKAVTTFVACNEPAAVVWAPAPQQKCDCQSDDDDHDGHHDKHHGDRDRADRRASLKRSHGGDHDGDHDRCECEHNDDHDREARDRDSSRKSFSLRSLLRDSARHHEDGRHDEDDDDDCPPQPAVSNTAYVACDTDATLLRVDLSTPVPTITSVFSEAAIQPSTLAIDPTGTHALVAGDAPTVSYVDLTTTPFTEKGPIVVPLVSVDPPINPSLADVAFYGSTKGVIVTETTLYVVDLTSTPPGNVLSSVGLNSPATTVAVDTANNRAVVGLDLGGVQFVDLTTTTLFGSEVGASGDSQGVAFAPAGTPAIALYESSSSSSSVPYAMVVPVSASPAVTTVSLSSGASPPATNDLLAPSAVAFNPVTSDALVVGDDGVAILKPPYTSVDSVIRYPAGFSGTTKHGIAAAPDGSRILVVNEDAPFPVLSPVNPGAPVTTPAVTPKHSGEGDHCHKRKHHGDDDDHPDGKRHHDD